MAILFAGLLGLVAGSFCAAASWRYMHGMSIIWPRSSCPHCGRRLTAFELFPVLSYLALRGRCFACGKAISLRYALTEGIYAIMTMLLVAEYGWTPAFWVLFSLTGLMLAASTIDAETFILPDGLTFTGAVAAVPCAVLWLNISWKDSLAGAVFGAGILWLLRWIFLKARGRETLGLGDVKYMAGLGGFTGVSGLPLAFLFSSLAALLWLVCLCLVGKGKGRALSQTPVPFGPFLSFGTMCTILWGKNFWLWLHQYL